MYSMITAPGRKHVQLLYGCVNDSFISDSLQWCDIEQMVLNLAKDAGAKYTLFYAGAHRGACCYDRDSAEFFFGDKKVHSTAAAPEHNDLQDVSIASMMNRNRGKTPAPQGNAQEPVKPESRQAQAAMKSVRFGQTKWTLSEVVTTFISLLNQPNAPRLALVFNNIQTTTLNSEPLLATLLTTLERHNANGSLCFILAPGTETRNLDFALRNVGPLSSVFSARSDTGCQTPVPEVTATWFLGEPSLDEIGNAISRLSIIGTPNGNKLRCTGRLHDLAHAVYYASHEHNGSGEAEQLVTMNFIMDKLIAYTDQAQGEALTVKNACAIFGASEPPKDALEQLNKPGWENAYNPLKRIVEDAKGFYERCHNGSGSGDASSFPERFAVPDLHDIRFRVPHFLIYGNPGTGKTSIVRLIGRVLYEAGILRKGNVIETSQAKLSSPYVGGIQTEVIKAVNTATESVLLLDDAQSLLKEDGGANHVPTGQLIIGAFIPEMTRRPFSLVLCGYDRILEILNMDEGLKRRIGENNIIHIPDYTPPLLQTIFVNVAAERGLVIDSSLLTPVPGDPRGRTPLTCLFENAYRMRDRKKFGNADFVVRLIDEGAVPRCKNGDTIRMEHLVGCEGVKADWFEPIDVNQSAALVMSEFEREIVGMTELKASLKTIARQIMHREHCGQPLDDLYCQPIILSAPPGAGKTTVAQVLSRLYFALGMLGTQDMITVSASDFNSSIINGNSESMQKYIHDAQDRKAMLFVDEAVQFLEPGRETAFKAFIEPLTNHKKPFMLVLACYSDRVNELLNLDLGARRRFRVMSIDDYNTDELLEIFHRQMSKAGYTITPDALKMMHPVCEAIHSMGDPNNRNGGATGILVGLLADLMLERINPDIDKAAYSSLSEDAERIQAVDVLTLVSRGCEVLNEEQCSWIMSRLQDMAESQ